MGSGGTGETIPIEFNDNLSHVDGAIGMARGQELIQQTPNGTLPKRKPMALTKKIRLVGVCNLWRGSTGDEPCSSHCFGTNLG